MPEARLDRRGLASPAHLITTATVHAGVQHVVTRSLHPTIVADYALAAGRVTGHAELPGVDGSWASTILHGDLYVGTYHGAELFRYEPGSGAVAHVASLPDDEFVWDLETDGEVLIAGTWPTGRVLEIDPEHGETRSYGPAVDGEDYVRSVAVTDEKIYAGVGSHAHLIRLDRASGERRQLLPDRFRDESFVYDVCVTEGYVVAGTAPAGHLCAIDRETEAVNSTATPIDAGGVGKLWAAADGHVLVGARRERDGQSLTALQRFDPATGSVEELAEFRGACVALTQDDGRIMGASSHGTVWRCESDGSAPETTDLAESGMPAGGERPQSIATVGDQPVVGGHGTFTLHEADSDDTTAVPVSGEPKAMAVVDGVVYAGIYTGAHLVAYDPDAGTVDRLGTAGEDQNRPRAVTHHPPSDRLLMATAPEYGHLGGAISDYDLTTGALRVHRNVVPEQSIHAIAVDGEVVYLGSDVRGGLGIEPTADVAELVRWDPAEAAVGWREPIPAASALIDLLAHDGRLYATARPADAAEPGTADAGAHEGELLVIQPAEGNVLDRTPLGGPPGGLLVKDGVVYTVSDDLLRVGNDGSLEPIVALDGEWYNWPVAAGGTDGSIWTVAGYDLARVLVG